MMSVRNAAGQLRGFAKVARDDTEGKTAENALREAYDFLELRVRERTAELVAANTELQNEISQRKKLEQEILRVSEREKRRIGQDLHDTLCQELTAAAFLLQSMANKTPAESAAFSEAAQIVNANVGLARDLARGLYPVELGTAGVTSALRELALRTNGKVDCRFESVRPVRIKNETISLNLYRIAQEAVSNSLKHGKPRQIVISLDRNRNGIALTVRDNWTGLRSKTKYKGMGIHIMTYRANVIGGNLSIESRPGRGTSVTCLIPSARRSESLVGGASVQRLTNDFGG